MTIDERIERLTERHEALAQSVEMLRDSVHETSDSIKAIGDLLGPMLVSMKTLADTALRHENRLDKLEGRA
jgi:hypothetical protein